MKGASRKKIKIHAPPNRQPRRPATGSAAAGGDGGLRESAAGSVSGYRSWPMAYCSAAESFW